MRGQRNCFVQRQSPSAWREPTAPHADDQHRVAATTRRSDPGGTALMNRHVQHGNHNQREEHGTDQAKCDGAAQWRPHARTRKDHRSDPDRRRHGGQEDGPQSALAGFNGGFLDCDAFRHSGANIVDQNDGVAHHDAAQTYDAQERRKAEWITCHQQAERCAQQAERNRRHDHQRIDDRTELKHQDQIDRDHAHQQRFHHLGKGVVLVFKFAAVPDPIPGGNR